MAFTGSYHLRPQMLFYSGSPSLRDGVDCVWADIDIFTGPDSPYSELRVLVHLDHADPDRDAEMVGFCCFVY